MPDDPKPDPITDEHIRCIVSLVETAEILAAALGVSVSRAVEIQYRTVQVLQQRMQKGEESKLAQMVGLSKLVQ